MSKSNPTDAEASDTHPSVEDENAQYRIPNWTAERMRKMHYPIINGKFMEGGLTPHQYMSREVEELLRADQLALLDRLEKETELKWYLRNEYHYDCNPQESGEVSVARNVTDAIEAERTRLTKEGAV